MKKLIEIYNILEKNNLIKKQCQVEQVDVLDITYDSREVKEGTLFFCKGAAFKKEYLEASLNNGAVAYVSETDYGFENGIIVSDIRRAMILVAAFFFDYPDRKLITIGVTGTKGKTTTVKFLKSIFDTYLEKNGKKKAGLISSINTYDGLEDKLATLTTPEAIQLYRHLHNAVESGLEYMIIETSSQAFKYHRVTEVEFDMGAFLNLGLDHVSPKEHPSFEDYFESKLKLVDQSKNFIINSKMDRFEDVKKRLEEGKVRYETFSLEDDKDAIYSSNRRFSLKETEFTAHYKGQAYNFIIEEPGQYNVENALCAILISFEMGLDYESIKKGLFTAHVEGRNLVVESDDKKVIAWVSYAHNGLSFEKTFETIKAMYGDIKIISMYGTPGDKARDRLIDMSKIGARNSDLVLIVPDDPGSRPFKEIADEMAELVEKEGCPYEIFDTRAAAIKRAFDLVEERTILFFAGKGEDKHDFVFGQNIVIEDDWTLTKREMNNYNSKH